VKDEPTAFRRSRNVLESLQFAAAGITHAWRTQRNVRTHGGIALLVVLVGLQVGLDRWEWAVIALTVAVVIGMEMLNTAVELVVDLVADDYHRLAELAKNVAAGAVLVTAMGAATVGYILFFDRLGSLHEGALRRTVSTPSAVILVALGLVLAVVAIMKARGASFRLRGGMPSLHTAIAGALATVVFFLADDGIVVLVAGLLSLLVAQSRVEGGIHTVFEVIVGGAVGVVATMAVFALLW